ncbi:MAG: hypothetical protein N0E48_04890 [Candidatus Thiodiazotropha endolucinida]|nr:hypothetical protein [Candidatus Thiodiazotropha taylori]MCW4342684.1 hypothetical protein [Candidatus Thiodiazotropha endolucinida]
MYSAPTHSEYLTRLAALAGRPGHQLWRPGAAAPNRRRNAEASRQKVRDRAQAWLFESHEKHFPDLPVPLLYRPKDTRRQNVMVTIPGPLVLGGRPD